MGKLHYVNRKIDGDRLAQVVKKDLEKRLPEKSGHKTAIRDPCIDFDATGKCLDDQALHVIYEGFMHTYPGNSEGHTIIKLEEFCLKGNNITARSLDGLATIVFLGAEHIRDIDLSDNKISIVSEKDAKAWEVFLSALGSCTLLRRVDLSGNAIGPKGFEVLARVHIVDDPDSCPFTPAISLAGTPAMTPSQMLEKRVNRLSLNGPECRVGVQSPMSNGHKRLSAPKTEIATYLKSPPMPETPWTPKTPGTPLPSTSPGLKHIPYIILDNTSMTTACALYLSYAIAGHDLPNKLIEDVPAAKAGPQTQQLEAYDDDKRCRGIMYRHNEGIGTAGKEVLDFAEKARPRQYAGYGEVAPEEDGEPETPISSVRRPSEQITSSTPAARTRTGSTISSPETHSPSVRVKSLDTTRSRIQGETIRDLGIQSNDLWWTSIRMLITARSVVLRSRLPQLQDTNARPRAPTLSNPDVSSPLAGARRLRSSSIALAPVNPNAPILRLQKNKHGATLTPEHKPIKHTPAENLKVITRDPVKTRPYRSNLPFGLSDDLWRNILAMATDADTYLSKKQQLDVMRRASDRESLQQEMGVLGKQESYQVWHVLDSMGCLAYERRA